MSDQYVRLYLSPSIGNAQQVIDVDVDNLIFSNGAFVSPQTATSITISRTPYSASYETFGAFPVTEALTVLSQDEVGICWREPVGTDQYPNENVVTAVDPSGGVCVCGITCAGTQLSYVVVQNVTSPTGY
jgi:hypothetical protein